jgi:dTDP-4-amino-4,6-dideoxygalactose transaminase
MNELNAVVLFEQLSNSTKLLNFRKKLTQSYYSKFKTLENEGYLKLMPANYVAENVHEFYVIVANEDQRNRLQKYLANKNIEAFFHYIPLHISKMGMEKGRNFDMKITSKTSNCLLRLPFHEGVTEANVSYIFNNVTDFFTKK